MKLLPASFYNRDTVEVARDLLGKEYIRRHGSQVFRGFIVETEAYRSDDEACHAYKGLTQRTAPLFGPVGHTYVYVCYGIHFCLNIVARATDKLPAGGVLIRGVSVSGHDEYPQRIDGPGRSAKALHITKADTGLNVMYEDSSLIILDAPTIPDEIITITPRIGISKSTEALWRFYYNDKELQRRR